VTQYPSTAAPAEIRDSRFRIWHNVLISGIALAAAFVLSINPDIFDRPLTGLINGFAGRSAFFDRLTFIVFSSSTFSGAVLVAMVWSCWFDTTDPESRSHILVGTLASFGAGAISRFLQYTLPTHPRPFYDSTLGFKMPANLDQPLNTWNSFPSDHVAVFAGLAIVIYIARSRFSFVAIAITVLAELARVYMGAHYPSDLIGGAALASLVVWATETWWFTSLGAGLSSGSGGRPLYFIWARSSLAIRLPRLPVTYDGQQAFFGIDSVDHPELASTVADKLGSGESTNQSAQAKSASRNPMVAVDCVWNRSRYRVINFAQFCGIGALLPSRKAHREI
jgi:membrane-associated phospholipid phosphatase